MPLLYTRRQFRDRVRRQLGKVPLIDITGQVSDEGQPAGNNPYPNNLAINEALDKATRIINARCRFSAPTAGVYGPLLAVATTFIGPFYVAMTYINTGGPNSPGNTNEIRALYWNDGTNAPVRLTPKSRESFDRDGFQWFNQPPGVPQWYWVESYQLAILPAPNVQGNLNFIAGGSALIAFMSDGDTLPNMPADLQDVWTDFATMELAGRQTQDTEAQELFERYKVEAEEGIGRVVTHLTGRSDEDMPSLGLMTYRQGYGTRRAFR